MTNALLHTVIIQTTQMEELAEFYQQGLEINAPPTEKPWGAKLAALFDPDGNVLGLAQRGTNPH